MERSFFIILSNINNRKVLIVGCGSYGIGGLASALRLVKNCYEVEIVEKHNKPVGKMIGWLLLY